MTKVLYSFYDADGMVLGSLQELELAVCPRSGEVVTFMTAGFEERRSFLVHHVTHLLHRDATGAVVQLVDISVRAM